MQGAGAASRCPSARIAVPSHPLLEARKSSFDIEQPSFKTSFPPARPAVSLQWPCNPSATSLPPLIFAGQPALFDLFTRLQQSAAQQHQVFCRV
jgi:hypothetical protein